MTDIRFILIFLLLLPAATLAQTIRIGKDKVLYQGKLEFVGASNEDVYQKTKNLLLHHVNPSPDSLIEKRNENTLASSAVVKLPSPYNLVKTLYYTVKLQSNGSEVAYQIDSIYVSIRKRGGKARIISSEEMLKGLGENGKTAMLAERQLNEIDLNIQKLIAIMKADLRKG